MVFKVDSVKLKENISRQFLLKKIDGENVFKFVKKTNDTLLRFNKRY